MNFIEYHRSYVEKPNRVFCRIVFAHLVSEVFCCRIGFEATTIDWIYPLNVEDYYIGMDIKTVLLKYVKEDRVFEVLQPRCPIPDSFPPMLFEPKVHTKQNIRM